LILLGFSVFNIMLNIGPNATTYLLPTEVYPTRLRATGHGVAAAAGKVGAVVGTFGLPLAVAAYGIRPTMAVIAVLSILGLAFTIAAKIETTGKVLTDEDV
jgi:nitrate/nitrite transporter NarK